MLRKRLPQGFAMESQRDLHGRETNEEDREQRARYTIRVKQGVIEEQRIIKTKQQRKHPRQIDQHRTHPHHHRRPFHHE